MLECRACVLRCIRAIASESVHPQHGALVLTPRLSANANPRRRLTTASAPAPQDAFSTSYPPSGRTNPKEEPTRLTSTTTERALQAELKFLTDPLKLASHIHYVLRQNNPAKALDLARLASKSARSSSDVVVSWNHCVDWHMRSGRVTEAVKIYNEMKKRGVFPDAHTYTILFRSFLPKTGKGVDEATVAKATSIYYSMLTPTSRVKPGIIHTNAVLRVCSLAGDMDALWGVAARIPEHGPGSADVVTYTILLSAIRYGAMGTAEEGGVYLDQIGGKRQSAVNEGRRIWMECIQKWRSGDLVIDAELVGAMGNLLLISNRMEDWDDVLSLVAQTTRIPRQIVPLDHPDRRIGHVPQETPIGDDVVQSSPTADEEQDGFLPTPASKAFNAISATNTSSPIWVHPGNPILRILIQACLTMRIPKAAIAYWEIITSPPYCLKPDIANYQAMIRLFRLNRSSAKAAALVELMHSSEGGSVSPRGYTYRDALAVCARDHKNPSVMALATRIVEDMGRHMQEHPDVPTLQAFLSLAMTTDSGHSISAAFDTLHAFLPQVISRIPGEEPSKKKTGQQGIGRDERKMSLKPTLNPEEEEALDFTKELASSIQKVMNVGMVPNDHMSKFLNWRNRLNRNIGRAENRNVRNWYFEGGEGVARNKTRRERELERSSGGAKGDGEKVLIRYGRRVGKGKRGEKQESERGGGGAKEDGEKVLIRYGAKDGQGNRGQKWNVKRAGSAESAGEMAER